MKKDRASIDRLIERSSLGTPRARTLRRHTPRELVQRTLNRADLLDTDWSEGKGERADIGVGRQPVASYDRQQDCYAMPDDLTKRRPQDASRINTSEEWEIRYWSAALSCTPEQLLAAVRAVDNSVAAVRKHLGR